MNQKNDAMRARQLNPADDLYWKSRGWDARPIDWQRRVATGDLLPNRQTDILSFELPSDLWDDSFGIRDLNPTVFEGAINSHSGNLVWSGSRGERNNPDHDAYWQARGWDAKPGRSEMNNPNNDAYWVLKGFSERPDDWKSRV